MTGDQNLVKFFKNFRRNNRKAQFNVKNIGQKNKRRQTGRGQTPHAPLLQIKSLDESEIKRKKKREGSQPEHRKSGQRNGQAGIKIKNGISGGGDGVIKHAQNFHRNAEKLGKFAPDDIVAVAVHRASDRFRFPLAYKNKKCQGKPAQSRRYQK